MTVPNYEGLELLFGHTGEDTAYEVDDYPYGRRVRTKIRYWIETKPKFGDRFVSQTLNPKTGRWNKPKRGTYSPVAVMARRLDNGHITAVGLRTWPDDDELGAFLGTVGLERLNEEQRRSLALIIARSRVFKHVTYTIRAGSLSAEEKAEHDAEQERLNGVIGRAVAGEAVRAARNLGVDLRGTRQGGE